MSLSVSNSSVPGGEGTAQAARFPAALDPSAAPLDGRSAADLTAFARDFADEIAFWHGQDTRWSNISWSDFLPEFADRSLEEIEAEAANRPQAALYLAFLRLYGLAQKDLNRLTDRHLRFYYRDVLGLAPRGPQPDHVHLLLGLKKGASDLRVPRETEFTTGDGLRYATGHEIFVQQVEVVHRRILAREERARRIVYAAEAASLDGLGTALPNDDPSWHPFGFRPDDEDPATEEVELPVARLGFAISSTALLLREGERTVTLKIEVPAGALKKKRAKKLAAALRADLEGFLSGEEEWIAAGIPTSPAVEVNKAPKSDGWELSIPFRLASDAPPVLPYDPTVLEGGFDTLAPVLKVLLKESAPDSLALALSRMQVDKISLAVSVKGMKELTLENDHGRLDASKAFMPFGPQPRRGSSFYVGAEEALTKDITSVRLHLQWNDPPADFKDHYEGYKTRRGRANLVNGNEEFTAKLEVLRDAQFEALQPKVSLFDKEDATKGVVIDSTQTTSEMLSFSGWKYARFVALRSRSVRSARLRFPFTDFRATRPLAPLPLKPVLAFRTTIRLPQLKLARFANARLQSSTRNGFLRLKLNKSFHHRRYPEIFAEVYSKAAKKEEKAVPPEAPYTPELSSFSLDYEAVGRDPLSPNEDSKGAFDGREMRFFHLTPFGQREEHAYIKSSLNKRGFKVPTELVKILPSLDNVGELYLGLAGLKPLQSISLLFQILEGSANPLSQTPSIAWSVLCSNHWKPLDPPNILAESTGSFLTSGVVRLLLPEETTLDNTILEPGLVWIRAAIQNDRSAVARVLALHPNAVPARLRNPEDATHLETTLPPGSVSASANVLRGLKSVEQPYTSTGGAAPESRRSFHTRTSERLRHRGAAITAWDFERLVLDAFPNIYLVRCLPHTEVIPDPDKADERTLASSPGQVTLVVIPDTRGSNVLDPLRPYADTATIAAIKKFIAGLHTPFAGVEVINPRFERLTLDFQAVFRAGLPPEAYQDILQEDLRRHISPWAYRDSLLPDFGGSVLRSDLIAFIESLDYIDYVFDFRLEPDSPSPAAGELQEYSVSSPDAILTSAPIHKINES